MKKKDFIKRFNLKKVGKDYFRDGTAIIERVVYTNGDDRYYIFLNNDLYSVNINLHTIGAGYSWYH